MPSRFKVLKNLSENTTSLLKLVRDSHLKSDFILRRFKTTAPGEIDGLRSLFAQLALLDSPRLDRIIEAAEDEKGFYVLTPAPLEGITLPEMLARGPLSAEEFETLANQLLDALELVHDQAIVHGTITPECVRIAGTKPSEWQVRLGGFGVGFAAAGPEEEHQVAAYRCAAPEQWQKSPARRRSDVYSLGCVLYEALAARPAFQSRTLKELRTKHLGHDLPDLAKLAPHVPAWMSSWVMSLIVTDAEARPRKAAVARESFLQREAQPAPAPAPVLVTPAAAPVPATNPPGYSAPILLPMTQPARHATASTIPIAVGPQVGPAPQPRRQPQPAAAPKAAPRQFSQQPGGRPLWQRPPVIAGAVIVILGLLWLLFGRSSGSGAGVLPAFDAPATNAAMINLRELGQWKQRQYLTGESVPAPALPTGLPKPFAADKLVVFHHADAGVNTHASGDADKPAREGDAVAFWNDYGPIHGNNAQALTPWTPGHNRVKLVTLKPDAARFPLSGPRRFVVFGASDTPVSTLGTIGMGGDTGSPFTDPTTSGFTMAIVFYLDATHKAPDSLVAHINFSGSTVTIRAPEDHQAWFFAGEKPGARIEPDAAAKFDFTKPVIGLLAWKRDGTISTVFHNSLGQRSASSEHSPAPAKRLQNVSLGGEPYYIWRDKGQSVAPFHGGIAEVRLYNTFFDTADLKQIEDELAKHYFP
ncbi:MAG: hypothetical protein JNN17_05185 [Verrucomicrobiaceae bacterium]|nr:hypothetical protein [Verrucomicrobiaceae bacterium]